ncbi:MAG TPA: type II toxin-antitoxin system Phd/YefM family antitoxin [Anaerolineae bacterium]|nr:type II toxin-antitoxin system Phd/YefM family antitoxin [Anaerolineae bacterium]
MNVFTFSEARQKFSKVLDLARTQEVIIKRRSGETFRIVYEKPVRSPFDVPGVETDATTEDILTAIRESRERG